MRSHVFQKMSALEDYEVLETSEKTLCDHILSLTSLDLYVKSMLVYDIPNVRSLQMVLRLL